MGQKVNPHGLRVGIINGWNTQWYADKKEFSKYLKEDNVIRTFLKKKYYSAAISKILIERAASRVAEAILEEFPVEAVTVLLKKPRAPIAADFAYVAVEITRRREDAR